MSKKQTYRSATFGRLLDVAKRYAETHAMDDMSSANHEALIAKADHIGAVSKDRRLLREEIVKKHADDVVNKIKSGATGNVADTVQESRPENRGMGGAGVAKRKVVSKRTSLPKSTFTPVSAERKPTSHTDECDLIALVRGVSGEYILNDGDSRMVRVYVPKRQRIPDRPVFLIGGWSIPEVPFDQRVITEHAFMRVEFIRADPDKFSVRGKVYIRNVLEAIQRIMHDAWKIQNEATSVKGNGGNEKEDAPQSTDGVIAIDSKDEHTQPGKSVGLFGSDNPHRPRSIELPAPETMH